MRFRKKTIILALILLSLFMIGAVSAASNTTETNVNADVSNDNTKVTTTTSNDNSDSSVDKTIKSTDIGTSDSLKKTEKRSTKNDTDNNLKENTYSKKISTYDENVLNDANPQEVNDWSELNTSIQNIPNGNTSSFILMGIQEEYIVDSAIMINNSKTIVIEGNNKTLNAQNKNRIFTVDNANLIIKNLNLINGKGEDEEIEDGIYNLGGVIYAHNNANLTVINCRFINNNADCGGAIDLEDYSQLKITNTNFKNNTAKSGGAIYTYNSQTNINNTTFTNNTANNGGTISSINSQTNINNTNFKNNTATNNGGAIHTDQNSKLNINNTTFTNNNATNNGGAINLAFNSQVNITNSTLQNNNANTYGGAIYAYNAKVNITNSTLQNNNANTYGGAILQQEGFLNIINSKFINTTASNHGGAIYIIDGLLNIVDSQFINTTASNHGGAIYINYGSMNITDSKFINNTAYSCGGAIAYENDADFDTISNIQRVQIINSTSIDDAGGAIYLKHTIVNMDNVNITSSKAIFGGAITSLKTNLKINHTNIINSTADYYGGAIYQMYGDLSVTNSSLLNTSAMNGGAFYIVLNENLTITDNKFNNNHADNKGNIIYLLLNQTTLIQDNIYNGQINPMVNDLYETSDVLGFIGNGNYTLYHINYTELPETYPDYYDLRELNLTTPVKDQKQGGNCWAFSAIGALESAILKASGESLDLSEENMKNLMSLYSIYGWGKETNDGGNNPMALSYLTSWLGPVYEYEDLYNDSSTLSPILNSMTHIQNIEYIKRNNATDTNGIKEALMKYGAVKSTMVMDEAYLNNVSYYYYNNKNYDLHSVLIVGWNDNYSKDNFKGNPEGNGAWIVKNSWGTDFGDEGYFYVSYYDTKFALLDFPTAYAIILNDTIKYDKNYQYDIQGWTDQFLNSSDTVWYKNVFNSTDNEYLAAASTYFYEDTNWELTIKVNNIIKGIQIGSSKAGYYTINLNQMIPLNIGDIFEVIFKITVNGEASIPISEYLSTNVMFYKENSSFVSYDGLNWQDLYDLKWSYGTHNYYSQVACIKAFTILNPVNTMLNLDIRNVTETTVDLVATVYNEYGYLVDSGNVTFTIGDKEEIVAVKNGIAKLNTLITSRDFSAKFEATGYTISTASKIIDTLVPTKIELSKSPVISAYISDLEGKAINSGFVLFNDGFENYTVDVLNGFANLTDILLKLGENQITARYKDLSDYYKSCTQIITITLNKTSFRYLNQQINDAINNNQKNISLNWDYKYDKETDYKFIKGISIINEFTIYGNNHTINGDGQARIFLINNNGDLTLENLSLVNGMGQNETLYDGSVWNVGGAIYVNGTTLTINNCNFTQNTVSEDEFGEGGAIYTGHNSQLNINNALFNSNKASAGGAVFINTNSELNINNTQFTSNNVTYAGGAIIGNTKSHINLNNSIFTNNNAKIYGGAIFIDNSSYLNINNTQFTNNTSINNGGAVFINNYANTIISNTNFTQNAVMDDNCGGAIHTGLKTNIVIYNCNFKKNNAESGGAIYIKGEATIIKSIFTQNNAGPYGYGGAIYAEQYSTVNINESTFTQNSVGYAGGAIYAGENSTVNISKSTFTQNNAEYGGAIVGYNATMIINESIFTQNNAGYGGAVYTEEYSIIDIINTNFMNNNANTYGGAIYTNASSKTTIINNNIIQNNAGYGGAIYNEDSDLIIMDSVLRDNMANMGGAIYSNGTSNISKSFFMDNQANNGGEIFATTPLIMNNNIIINTQTQKSIQGTIIGNNNQIYDSQINYLLSIINEKEKEIQNINNTLNKTQTALNNATNNINTLNQNIQTQTTTIKQLNQTTNNQKNIINTLNNEINTLKKQIENLKQQQKTTKTTTKIIAKPKTYKTKTKIKKYTITLKSGNKTIKKAKITLKIKGKTYTKKTNNKGKATFKITNLNKKGKYKTTITYKGNKKYKASKKTVKIIVK